MKIAPFFRLLFAAAALTATAASAQPAAPAPEKELLIVDFFNRIREIPAPYTETLRGHVLDGFAARGRHRLLDAEASRVLAATAPGTGITDPATAEADMAALLAARAPEAVALGARYLVSGTLAAYRFDHVDLPPAASGKPPRPGFKAAFRVILSGLDLKLGTRLPDEAFDLTASAPAATDADLAALARIRGSLEYYIDRNFKFETQILELCPADRKGRLRELYIHSGTAMGVKRGDLFLVYEEVPVGGVITRQKVGRLRVTDAANPEVARCKVAKGDDEIARAFAAGRTLICVSDGKAFGY
ncbi:hypothetical protein [Alistipes sp.]|uniref:hypothetical protein n=1 Tax=Alistipes sp. TaxID=1872444 RepID=UPI003AF1606D